jgi:hypothetical protein
MPSDRITPTEVGELFKALLEHTVPGIKGFAWPIRARVVKVNEAGGKVDAMHRRYSVDVQPLARDGSVDEQAPVIPDVELSPLWAGELTGMFALPPVGALVRVGFYYWDPGLPFVDAVLADGYEVPAHPQGKLFIQRGAVRVEVADGLVTIVAPQVLLGEAADAAAVRVTELLAWLNAHSHMVEGVASLPPTVPCGPEVGSTTVRIK